MRRLLPLLLLLASIGSAFAQGGVLQSGVTTSGHLVQWLKNGVIADAGMPFTANGLPLSGGTLLVEPAQSFIQLKPLVAAGAFSLHAAQLFSQWNTNASGGTPGDTMFNGYFYTSIFGAPNEYLWTLQATVDYDGTGGNGQHVGLSGQAVRRRTNGGGTANNPELWGGLLQVNDLTATNSSVSNSEIGLEIDMGNNGLDDANNRSGLVIISSRQDHTSSTYGQITNGIGLSSNTINDTFKTGIQVGITYTIAALDFRSSTGLSGHTLWLRDGEDIAFDTVGLNILSYKPAAISAAGAVVLTHNLEVDGATVYFPNAGLVLGGAANIGGILNANLGLNLTGKITMVTNSALVSNNQSSGTGSGAGTLTNAPANGNPAFWIPWTLNGTLGWIPWWHL